MTDEICQVDNKIIFDYEEDYTTQCECCNLFCKIYHYRACLKRHKWNLDNNIDIFERVREADKLAQAQLGIKIDSKLPPKKQDDKKEKKKISRHRGR